MMKRYQYDYAILAAELEGLAAIANIAADAFLEDDTVRFQPETIGQVFFAIQRYAERIGDSVAEMEEKRMEPTKTDMSA